MSASPRFLVIRGADVELRVKAVPGAKREEIAGVLGDRLKIRVAAPPEGGKANDAICALIAKRLSMRERDVVVTHGEANPHKTISLHGAASRADVLAALFTQSA